MVAVPFNVACGHCKTCEPGLTNYCITAQRHEGWAGAAYGFADMGPYEGGHAEYLRVPWGDFNCLRLAEDAGEKQNDYVMLSDIFPTGYHATEMSGLQPGESVVIYGAGPVGLMAAHSAAIKNARMIMIVGTGQCPVKVTTGTCATSSTWKGQAVVDHLATSSRSSMRRMPTSISTGGMTVVLAAGKSNGRTGAA
jgi:threonine dehydrogenase-like Zn-dependent dehydrogenase